MAKSEQEIADALRPVWELNKKFCLKRGVDLPNALVKWSLRIEKSLDHFLARGDFQRLSEDGCCPQLLALLISAIALAPGLDNIWREVVGSSRGRSQIVRNLENAAGALESTELRLAHLGGEESPKIWPDDSKMPTFKELAVWLRLYAAFLHSVGYLKLGKIPFLVLSKFGLSEYVQRKTGRPHDKEVATLIGVSLRDADYNETSHKMWRNRNFDHLQRSYPQLPQFLLALDILVNSEK